MHPPVPLLTVPDGFVEINHLQFARFAQPYVQGEPTRRNENGYVSTEWRLQVPGDLARVHAYEKGGTRVFLNLAAYTRFVEEGVAVAAPTRYGRYTRGPR